jgi:AraC-like DNA-binding protein
LVETRRQNAEDEDNMDLRQKSVSARIYRFVLDEAECNGFDRENIARKIGLDEVELAASDARVAGDKHVRLLSMAERQFAKRDYPMTDVYQALCLFPELAAVVCNSMTLRDALRNVVEHRDQIGNVDWLLMEESDDAVAFDYVLEGEGRSTACALGNFALLASVARLYDPRARVGEAGVTDARIPYFTGMDDALGIRIGLSQARNRMVLRSSALDAPFAAFNPALASICVPAARALQQKIRARGRFAPMVEQCLRDVLRANADAIQSKGLQALVCERLALTRWTLQRRLAAEELAFSDVLAQTRVHQARELLARTNLPISEIAERVGFASTAAFTRFFARSCGDPPTRFRERQRTVA